MPAASYASNNVATITVTAINGGLGAQIDCLYVAGIIPGYATTPTLRLVSNNVGGNIRWTVSTTGTTVLAKHRPKQ